MIRRLFVSLIAVLTLSTAMAQLNGDGYYRVKNYASSRWAYLTDNHAPMDASATKIDLAAIQLWKDTEKYLSDPSTVIYIKSVGNSEYDIFGQGTSVHAMANYYLTIGQNPNYSGVYKVYGSYSGIARVLTDPTTNLYFDYSEMSDKEDAAYPKFSYWYLKPVVSNSSDCYFGIKPTVTDNKGKHYAAIYTGFPYQVGSGDKAYYVYKLDTEHGIAIYKEVPNGKVDAGMGAFQMVTSVSPSENKVTVGVSGATKPSDNKMTGAYFSRTDAKHTSFTAYKSANMRLFGLLSDGSIGFITPTTSPDKDRVPANTSYLWVPENSPANFKLLTDAEYAEYLANLVVEAQSVTLNKTSVSIEVGKTVQLTATVAPANTTDKTIAWTSSNSSVASVDANGLVTAKSVGNAVITATCGNAKATCSVEVKPVLAQSITLSSTSLELLQGSTHTLTATVNPANTTDKTVTWSSSNASVASVDANGLVAAKSVGTATITAKCGSVQATCAVTVKPVLAESVTLSATTLEIFVGETATLTATVSPDNTTDKTVTWTSSNTSIATIDKNGKITAKAQGEVSITAKCGSAQATCAVTVKPVLAESITLSATTLEILVGEETRLSATVLPENTTDKKVTWTISDSSVAYLGSTGRVVGKKPGTATVTAKCGDVEATCEVTVKPVLAESITLSATYLEIQLGGTESLWADLTPDNVTYPTIEWTSSAPDIASVSSAGVVNGLQIGEAIITAKCGDVQATCHVEVQPIDVLYILMSYTALDMVEGETQMLSAVVYPDNATFKYLTWISTEPEVASVSSEGVVTAHSEGQTEIIVLCGEITASCHVNVIKLVEDSLVLTPIAMSLHVGDTAPISVAVYNHTGDETIEWSTSDKSIATVDDWGNVSAQSAGVAVITARCGEMEATCTVTVVKRSQSIEWSQSFDDVKDTDVVTLTAQASSGLEVTYEIISGWDCVSLEGNVLTMLKAGTFTIEARQEGDNEYMAAEPVRKTINILSGLESVIADGVIVIEPGKIINPACVKIDVYTLQGVLVASGCERELSLAPGVYIISVDGQVIKVKL